MQQNSTDWYEWRSKGIGSSDVATILGFSPYLTPYQLWRIKVGLDAQAVDNPATYRGRKFEDKARATFELTHSKDYKPRLFQSAQYPFMRVSLDGWSEEGREVLEIKVPGKATMDLARDGKIPMHYLAQIQYQLFVADGSSAIYFAYQPETELAFEVRVLPDQEFIRNMIALVHQFWIQVQRKEPPPLTDQDWAEIPRDYQHHCLAWIQGGPATKHVAKLELIKSLKTKKARGFGIKIFPVVRNGIERFVVQEDKKEERKRENEI